MENLAPSDTGNPLNRRSTTMVRHIWHFGLDGWPLERIDTLTGEHVPVFTGEPEVSLPPEYGGRPLACSMPKVSGVLLGWRC